MLINEIENILYCNIIMTVLSDFRYSFPVIIAENIVHQYTRDIIMCNLFSLSNKTLEIDK